MKLLAGPQRNTLLFGGARSGKTFLIVRAILLRAANYPGSRHVILRHRANAARASISLDTLPKARQLIVPNIPLLEHRQEGYYEMPNGSQIWIAGLDDKARVEKILGMEFATLFLNECSQIAYASVHVARTRLAQQIPGLTQRAYYDLNPAGAGHWTNQEFGLLKQADSREMLHDPDNYVRMGLNPTDNSANLSPEFLASLDNLPMKQRRRFYEGVYVSEIDGALWTYERLDAARCDLADVPDLQRIVVAIDPSGAKGPEDKRSDEIGIVVAGRGVDGKCYILEDLTCKLGPAGWAMVAVRAFYRWRADCIVAETNYGGAMVESTIRTADENVPFKSVTASRGKVVRAEPVAALYEEKIDLVRHVNNANGTTMAELEEQLTMFSTAGWTGERSPDRADAMVWAVTELMLEKMGSGMALLEVVRQEMAKEKANKDAPTPIAKEFAIGSVEHMKLMSGL